MTAQYWSQWSDLDESDVNDRYEDDDIDFDNDDIDDEDTPSPDEGDDE